MASSVGFLYSVLLHSVAATNISFNGGFDRHVCWHRTRDLVTNGYLSSDDPVFFRDETGRSMFESERLTLTLPGCERLCGPKHIWYSDIGPRLSIWLIPILLLLSNIELSPLDKRRFLAILHILGDPIDSIWSLVHKIDCLDWCYYLAASPARGCKQCQRVIAAVFAGYEEIDGPGIKTQAYFIALASERKLDSHFHEWRRTAIKLADSRTNEFPRTCLAILLYIFQLVASFVKEVGGGSSSPPGGRIATGVFLSWLVPAVLLSNVVGGFTSRRTCYDILSDFADRTGGPLTIPHTHSVLLPSFSSVARTRFIDCFPSLGWTGAIYTFRPWKVENSVLKRRQCRATLAFLVGVSPVCIGMSGGFVILWYSLLTGLSCRHAWLMGIFLLWLLSTFTTWISYSSKFTTGVYHWRFVLIKDALVAVPSVTLIVLSACGLFNTCYCWSGVMYYGEKARVPLNGDAVYELRNRTIYPLVVGVSLAIQFLVFAFIVVVWRRGLMVVRWSDRARNVEWKRVIAHEECHCSRSTVQQSSSDSSLVK